MAPEILWCLGAMLPELLIVSMVSLLLVVLEAPMVYLVSVAYNT